MTRKRNNLLVYAATGVAMAFAGGLYWYYSGARETVDTKRETKITKKTVVVVLTNSVLSSDLPINEILKDSNDVIFILPPGFTKENDINQEIDAEVSYKIIECDTYQGMHSVIQHLGCNCLLYIPDELDEPMPVELPRYVHGSVVQLEQNKKNILDNIMYRLMNV